VAQRDLKRQKKEALLLIFFARDRRERALSRDSMLNHEAVWCFVPHRSAASIAGCSTNSKIYLQSARGRFRNSSRDAWKG
jgi:hypothetical protein